MWLKTLNHSGSVIRMTNYIKCPLCDSKAKYKPIKNKEKTIHRWICDECPFIGYEVY